MDGYPRLGDRFRPARRMSLNRPFGDRMKRAGDILGYARVSTAERVFEDVVSGKTFERPGLAALLNYARPGDTLAVIRLDRLGRSLAELLGTVDGLKAGGIGLVSLEERIDTTSAARAEADLRAHEGRAGERQEAWTETGQATLGRRYGLRPAGARRRRRIRLAGGRTSRHRPVDSLQVIGKASETDVRR